MNQMSPQARFDFIPDSAPFSVEQRAWLNGFIAGLVSPDTGVTALSAESGAADWIVTCWLRASCPRPSRRTQMRTLL